MAEEKVRLASHEWLELVRRYLPELVSRDGNDGHRFSMCEVFLDAPSGLVGSRDGRAAWHFRIDGRSTTADSGEVDDVDLKFILDYREAEQLAKVVFAEGDEGASRASSLKIEGDPATTPPFLRELHNLLAPRTR